MSSPFLLSLKVSSVVSESPCILLIVLLFFLFFNKIISYASHQGSNVLLFLREVHNENNLYMSLWELLHRGINVPASIQNYQNKREWCLSKIGARLCITGSGTVLGKSCLLWNNCLWIRVTILAYLTVIPETITNA